VKNTSTTLQLTRLDGLQTAHASSNDGVGGCDVVKPNIVTGWVCRPTSYIFGDA